MKHQTSSRTSPKSSRRGCLGKDGKYSVKNCKGYMIQQGLGALSGQGYSEIGHVPRAFSDGFSNGFE